MSSGHWKLWHDTRGRFFVGLLLVGMALFGGYKAGGQRVRACVASRESDSWQLIRSRLLSDLRSGTNERYNALMIGDGDIISAHCAAGELPDPVYAAEVQIQTGKYSDVTWDALAYLLLFVGILLSVGPPFSGESMEAFSLTFSLPWSREKWLTNKVVMSVVLLTALTALALVVTVLMCQFRYVRGLHGGYPGTPPIVYPTIWHVFGAYLAGLVGIALGTAASMYARNVLTATVIAGITAYILVAFEIIAPFGRNISTLTRNNSFSPLTAFAVISCAALLATNRLRNTDY